MKFILWAAAITLAVGVTGVLLSRLNAGANYTRLWRNLHEFIAAFGGWIGVAIVGFCAIGVLLLFDSLMPDEASPRDVSDQK